MESVENVEWLWQRDFTLIELQHILNLPDDFRYNTNKKSGFLGVTFSVEKNQTLHDPDGYEVYLCR